MKHFFVLVATMIMVVNGIGQPTNTKLIGTLDRLITKQQYEQLFPHHSKLYTYEAFIEASKSFPLFANEGDTLQQKRELIAFLANIAHETTNGWPEAPGGPYVWGLVFIEEQACKKTPCPVYNNGGNSGFKPVAGKNYYGRGPMQISYAYNYGLAGKELHLPLLQNPEMVSNNGIIAFKTAFWFWMRAQKPKPSCHDVMSGNWIPTPQDIALKRKHGFGLTIHIINGGLECNTNNKERIYNRNERIGFYKHFAQIMKISVEEDCDCKGMGNF